MEGIGAHRFALFQSLQGALLGLKGMTSSPLCALSSAFRLHCGAQNIPVTHRVNWDKFNYCSSTILYGKAWWVWLQ